MSQYSLDKERLQRYMPQLRGCAGLSAEALASKVDLTKQAISYMETHLEKPMTKMQYICIRAAFDEEYKKNPDNINLRDCYDLVFSAPEFYKENKDKIEYALYQAVEDTKLQRRKNRSDAKKNAVTGASAAASLAGATSATMAVGGIASVAFPMVFPLVGIVLAAATTQGKKKDKDEKHKRASSGIRHSQWMADAFEATEDENSKDS